MTTDESVWAQAAPCSRILGDRAEATKDAAEQLVGFRHLGERVYEPTEALFEASLRVRLAIDAALKASWQALHHAVEVDSAIEAYRTVRAHHDARRRSQLLSKAAE